MLRVVDVDRLHGHQNHEDGQNCAVDNNSNSVDYSEVVFVDGDQEGPAYGGYQDEDVHAGGDAGGGVEDGEEEEREVEEKVVVFYEDV